MERDSGYRRIIVGVTGASGIVYAVKLLQVLRDLDVETHLVVTKAAELTISQESPISLAEVKELADKNYPVKNIGAAIASGSFKTRGMIVIPCSANTLAEIAVGNSSNLLTRAADVCLKERRRLVLVVRETPLHLGHLRAMVAVSEIGAIIAPPVPAFYIKPKSLDDVVEYTVGRVLDLFELESNLSNRWQGLE
jgi:flavin prenyltransferase